MIIKTRKPIMPCLDGSIARHSFALVLFKYLRASKLTSFAFLLLKCYIHVWVFAFTILYITELDMCPCPWKMTVEANELWYFSFFFLLFFVCCCFWDSAMWRVRVSEIERDESASSQTDKTKIGNYTKRDGTVLKGTVRNYYQGQVEEQRWMTRSLAND